MNRINQLFTNKNKNVLNVYFTAGYPQLDNTVHIANYLEQSGVDVIEIGIPFSDPVADGPTIQESNKIALDNGMNISLLFEQLKELRANVSIPVILMGYINPILQFGMEAFCKSCNDVGVDGLIIPDLPLNIYTEEYSLLFEKFQLKNISLITPQTSVERIRKIDATSNSFIYMVSSSSVTGAKYGISTEQSQYFKRIEKLNLINPRLIGFGISDKQSFQEACKYAQGAIIGSAFINLLSKGDSLNKDIHEFINSIKHQTLLSND